MADTYEYKSEDSKIYKIKLKKIKKAGAEQLVLIFVDKSESNNSYSSNYQLLNLLIPPFCKGSSKYFQYVSP